MNSPAAESTQSRALVMVVDVEVQTLNPKTTGPTNPARTTRIFNAGLTLIDPRDGVHPYMVEALPQLNTDTWRVASDGSMETVWRLRPGLLWHDGTPITAEDFAFAYRVYANSSLGIFGPAPQSLMTEVVGTDPRTLVIRWSITYPDADRLTDGSFGALPRHVLEPAFTAFERDPAARDAFLALPYWTTKYVGSGPYRLTSWERACNSGGRLRRASAREAEDRACGRAVHPRRNIGTAQNRWGGQNRGGWSNAEFDRLQEAYQTTLDPQSRRAQMVEMAKLLSEQVPVYPLFPNLGAISHLSILKGPEASPTSWNIHDWEWTA